MTTQYSSGRGSSGTFLVVLLSLVLGAAAVVVFIRHATNGIMARVATAITGRTTTFDTSVPAVVQRIQRLNRLETVVYSIDTVVEGSKSSAVLPDLLAGDRILLVVHGQSIAGIDLAQLKPEDVRITDKDGANPSTSPSRPRSSSSPASTTSTPASTSAPPASSSPPTPTSKPTPAPRPSSSSRPPRSPTASSTPPAKTPAPPSPPSSTASASTK